MLRAQGEAGGRGFGGIPPAERMFTPAPIPGGGDADPDAVTSEPDVILDTPEPLRQIVRI